MGDDGKIEIELATKVGEALRGFDSLNKSVSQLVGKIGSLTKESQTTDAATRRLGVEAKRVFEETRTATESTAQKQADLNRLYEAGVIDLDTYNRKMLQLGATGQGAFGAIRNWGASTVGQLVGITSAAGLALKALELVNRELDAQTARQERAASQQVGEAPAIRSIMRSLGMQADMTPAEAVSEAGKIAADTGASRQAVLEAASGVLSARGSLTASESYTALRATARLDPSLAGGDLQQIAGGAIDLRKAYGGTSEQALGMLVSGLQTARVEDVGKYAQNIVPAVLGLSNDAYGLSAKEAIGLTSAFTLITGDKRGESAGTGTLQFVRQLREATAGTAAEGKGLEGMLAYLDEDPAGQRKHDQLVGTLGRKISTAKRRLKPGEELTGEAKTLPAMLGILTKGSKEREELLAAMRATPELAEAGGIYEKNIAAQGEVPQLQSARVDEAFRGSLEQLRGHGERGMRGVIQKRLGELVDDAGLTSTLDREWLMKEFELRSLTGDVGSGLDFAEEELRRQQGIALRRPGYLLGREARTRSQNGLAPQIDITEIPAALRGGRADVARIDQLSPLTPQERELTETLIALREAISGLREDYKAAQKAGANGPRPALSRPAGAP